MQQITSYLYHRWIECLIHAPGTTTTGNPYMYAQPIVVYQNIDNPLRFVFKDLDQKRVDIAGYQLSMSIVSSITPTANQIVKTATTVVAVGDGSSQETSITNGTTNNTAGTSFAMTVLDTGTDTALRGVATVVLPQSVLNTLCPDDYWYSIRATNAAGQTMPTFIDGNNNARGTLKIIGGVFT